MDAETLESAQNRINEIGSLRRAARELDISAGTLSDIINGRADHVSLRTENKVRAALGLPALHYHTVPACPDCGSVHVGRCHNKPVAVRPVRLRRGKSVAEKIGACRPPVNGCTLAVSCSVMPAAPPPPVVRPGRHYRRDGSVCRDKAAAVESVGGLVVPNFSVNYLVQTA